MNYTLNIECGPLERDGRRKVTATLGKRKHVDKFDTSDSFKRTKFRESLIGKFELTEDAHEAIEQKILAAAESPESIRTLDVVNASTITTRRAEWFWDSYIPAAAITDISGDPGEGKSQVCIDLVARNSRGDSMPPYCFPDGACKPADSLLLSGEDDLERTVTPRLMAAGAKLERVHLLRGVMTSDDKRHVQLPSDLPLIEQLIFDRKISLVVVDVMAAFTEPGISLNDDAHMRRLFNQMKVVFERTGAACIMLRHNNKKEGSRAMYRAGGSIGITGACRAAFAIGANPEDPDEKLLVPIKHNLGPRPHSLSYRIESVGESSRIVWVGQSNLTATDVFKSKSDSPGGSKVEAAKEIIQGILSAGPRGENEVKTACEQAGHSYATYWRARKAIGVTSEKAAFRGEWILSLPSVNGFTHDEMGEGYHEDYQA